jgi:hypothetical protein
MLKQLASLSALVVVAALAQIPSQTAPTPTHSPIPRQHAPRRHADFRADRVVDNVTVSDSTNWSGYAVTGTSFTKALGSWTHSDGDLLEDSEYVFLVLGWPRRMELHDGRADRNGLRL